MPKTTQADALRARSPIDSQVAEVLGLIDGALAGAPHSIHDFRISARTLRSALLTLPARPDKRLVAKTRDDLRTAIRALADVRDRDVGRQLLKGIVARGSRVSLKRRMVALAAGDRQAALNAAAASWPTKLGQRLAKVLEGARPSFVAVHRRVLKDVRRQRRHSIDLVRSMGATYAPNRLHDLRIGIRRLRYALELLAIIDSIAFVPVAPLKPLQTVLGDAQDRIVLSRWLRGQAKRIAATDPSFAKALEAEAKRFRDQASRRRTAFLKLAPKKVLKGLSVGHKGETTPSDH